MSDTGSEKTVEIKECIACGGALLQTDRFCRWCSARQYESDSANVVLITERLEDTAFCQSVDREEAMSVPYRPVSGPLVKAMARGVSTGALSHPRSRFAQTLITALVSFPVWLMIVFLSPFDAYSVARSMAKRG